MSFLLRDIPLRVFYKFGQNVLFTFRVRALSFARPFFFTFFTFTFILTLFSLSFLVGLSRPVWVRCIYCCNCGTLSSLSLFCSSESFLLWEYLQISRSHFPCCIISKQTPLGLSLFPAAFPSPFGLLPLVLHRTLNEGMENCRNSGL